MCFFDGDDDVKEERVIDHVFEDENYGWMARTLLLGDEGNKDEACAYALETGANETEMKRMIDKYSAPDSKKNQDMIAVLVSSSVSSLDSGLGRVSGRVLF